MSGDVVCDCGFCICGAAKKYKLSISGVTSCGDTPCDDCASIDGTYILEQRPLPESRCRWAYDAVGPCTWLNHWELGIGENADCTVRMDVSYYTKPTRWVAASVSHCWADRYELTGGGGCWPDATGVPSCQFPSTITLEPVGIYSLEDTDCILGETCLKATKVPEPELNPPSCHLGMKCGCAACEAAAQQAAMRIPSPLGGAGGCGCAPGCDVELNTNSGNLSVRLGMPDAGALAPVDVVSYHSRGAGSSPMGYGVQSAYTAQVIPKNACGALLVRCDGSQYCFAAKNPATGEYRYIPPGAPSILRKTADGWEETEPPPNGKKFTYDSSGQLLSITAPGGRGWTMTYGSGLSSITDPVGRLTTYVYDGSGNVQRIVDVHGRSTTFVVDANGNLTKRISPELCITELV